MAGRDPNFDDRLASKWVNLAEDRLGAKVLWASDDFFAEKENLIKPGRGIFIVDKYTDRGKWMDGWESRRKRIPGNDACILKLGTPGVIHGFDIDTNFFLGNHPPYASVDVCESESDPNQTFKWTEILPKSPLLPGSQNFFEITNAKRWTHVRLQIYPDGGVARFRVFGEVLVDWRCVGASDLIDLASVMNGGKVLLCNDSFFGPKDNLIMPGRGVNMGDGWETRRKRGPGNDWVVLELGHRGVLSKIEVDTAHFKGNFPDRFSLEGIEASRGEILSGETLSWKELVPKTKLEADKQHYFDGLPSTQVTHVRLNIFPDGGVSRLRLWGKPIA